VGANPPSASCSSHLGVPSQGKGLQGRPAIGLEFEA
jgi:hypothetical protein